MASIWHPRRTSSSGGSGLKRLTGSIQTPTLPLFSPTSWYNQIAAAFGEDETPPMSLTSSEAGTSNLSTETAISSQFSETGEHGPGSFEKIAQDSAGYGCDQPGLELDGESQSVYRFKSTLYVARSRFVKLDAEVASTWQKEVKPRLQTDLRPVMERIRAKACSKPIQESAVFLDLRLSGYLNKGTGRKVRLFPTIWILCGSKWCKKMISSVVKDLAWLSVFDLGMEIHQGGPLPAASDTVEVDSVLSVDPDTYIALPNGEKLWAHIQSSGSDGSCNGLICCYTTEKAGEYRQVVSKIGGAMTSEKSNTLGVTTAHGLFSICTPTVQDDSSSASESDLFSDSESVSSLESEATSAHEDVFEQTKLEDGDIVLGQIHVSNDSQWLNISKQISAHFLQQNLDHGVIAKQKSLVDYEDHNGETRPKPDFALIHAEVANHFRNIIYEETHSHGKHTEQSTDATACSLVLGQGEAVDASLVSEEIGYYLGGEEVAVQKVELPGRLAGNSGSWIFHDNKLLGMVLANSTIEPFALAITADKLQVDIASVHSELQDMRVEVERVACISSDVASYDSRPLKLLHEENQTEHRVYDGPDLRASQQNSEPSGGLGDNLVEILRTMRLTDATKHNVASSTTYTSFTDCEVSTDQTASTDLESLQGVNEGDTTKYDDEIKALKLALEAELGQASEQRQTYKLAQADLDQNRQGIERAEARIKKEQETLVQALKENNQHRREIASFQKQITSTALENNELQDKITAAKVELAEKKARQKKKQTSYTSTDRVVIPNTSRAPPSQPSSYYSGPGTRRRRQPTYSDSGYDSISASIPRPIAAYSIGPDSWMQPTPPEIEFIRTMYQPRRRSDDDLRARFTERSASRDSADTTSLTRRASSRDLPQPIDDRLRMPAPPRPSQSIPIPMASGDGRPSQRRRPVEYYSTVPREEPRPARKPRRAGNAYIEDIDEDGNVLGGTKVFASSPQPPSGVTTREVNSGMPLRRRRSFTTVHERDPMVLAASKETTYQPATEQNSYEGMVAATAGYQRITSSTETLPLTAEALRQLSGKAGTRKSTITHGHNHDSSSKGTVKTVSSRTSKATTVTAATDLSDIEDDEITIRVQGNAKIMVGDAEVTCQDGGEINISNKRTDSGERSRTSSVISRRTRPRAPVTVHDRSEVNRREEAEFTERLIARFADVERRPNQ